MNRKRGASAGVAHPARGIFSVHPLAERQLGRLLIPDPLFEEIPDQLGALDEASVREPIPIDMSVVAPRSAFDTTPQDPNKLFPVHQFPL